MVCSMDEGVVMFMDQLLATPGVALEGEGGEEEEGQRRMRQRGVVVKEFLKLVEDGAFATGMAHS